ncbi:MAG TPA: cytochrome P450 [Polyangiaceae bacterium]|nr:cytochrome P450 [Polyangiaceae bacterium]
MGKRPNLNFNPLASPHLEDPYPLYQRLRREAPVVHNPTFDLWFVTRHADVVEVLRDPARFSSADVLKPVLEPTPEIRAALGEWQSGVYPLLSSDPPWHTRARSLVSRAFSAPRVAALEPQIRAIADELIDGFAAEGEGDLLPRFAYPLPMRLTGEMFGVSRADMGAVKRWCDEETLYLMAPLPHEQRLAYARSVVAYREFLRDLVEGHRRRPRGDLVDELLGARLEGGDPLTTGEIVGSLCVLIFAAHETTTNMLGNTLLCLLRAPGRWRALRDDPAQIPAALEEGLRFDAPVQGMTRTVTRATELGGVALPVRARLFVVFASANRDEASAADPDVFDPGRAAPHLSFGRGPHFCVGASLARLEGRVALERLALRLPGLRLADERTPAYPPNLVHRGPSALRLAWDVA